ncbi:YciI family protein [Dactylosporangium sp. AC04546]|uniref:YciI family protein n=1 Tax=Dactylosporangium sp. AC04546 TaxID=2862460 RepID=UPI001EDEB2DB|nr:YciI family protein [Dactylosporangium sp. AC04546]WVK88614.1 YciI family protein [Dactylosporangium sp. AC04546]
MRYLMLIYGNEARWNSLTPEQLAALIDEVDAFNSALDESGELLGADGLIPRARAVRMGQDGPVVTDGPYLEVKEFVGSYLVVDVDDDARAVEIARSYPGLRYGGNVELWPLIARR